MNNHIKDGGPAFPRAPIGEDCERPYGQQEGMSLRDWIAATVDPKLEITNQAGADLVADFLGVDREPVTKGDDPNLAYMIKLAAFFRYKFADAMIAAREGQK
jgi:hypothetical protein